MIERLKKAIDSYWARSKVFRLTVIVAFFVLVIASAFLLRVYILFHEYYSLMFVIILTILVVVAYKKGYGKQFSPKRRRLILLVSFCLGISIIIFALLRELFGPATISATLGLTGFRHSVQNMGFRPTWNLHRHGLNNRRIHIFHNSHESIHVGE